MKNLTVDLDFVRKTAFQSQLLADSEHGLGKKNLIKIIDQLGYIQIDTISVLQRAHHHTLWTRQHSYLPEMLNTLQAEDRAVFEYWGHAASFLPMADYRFYLPKMKKFAEGKSKWVRELTRKYSSYLEPVMNRIRAEGPLCSKDFKRKPGEKRGPWWDWKPAKMALELLFWRGDLMISSRIKFQKYYDLTERVLPTGVDLTCPDQEELGRFCIRRALQAYGFAREKEIAEHIHAASRKTIKNTLKVMLDEKKILAVHIEGIKDKVYYCLTETLANSVKDCREIFFISPFDNLIIQRERTRSLFNLDYALECYLPQKKRKYGYFVIPVFLGTDPLFRMDAKADRKNSILIIKSLHSENRDLIDDTVLTSFQGKLHKFAEFNGCNKIKLETANPPGLHNSLKMIN